MCREEASLAEDTGTRKTKQRRQLLEILGRRTEPLTAEQILQVCRPECPNMALTTVYRNLERMVEAGLAAKITHASGAARFTVIKPSKRAVLCCRICQRRIELDDVPLEALEQVLAQRSGYEIEYRHLEFYGVCPQCRRREAP